MATNGFQKYFLCKPAPALHHTERLQFLNSWKEQSPGMEVFLYSLKSLNSNELSFCMASHQWFLTIFMSFLYGQKTFISNVLPQWELIRIQTNAAPDPSQTLPSQKSELYINVLFVGNRSYLRRHEAFLKGYKSALYVNFVQYHSQYGSGSMGAKSSILRPEKKSIFLSQSPQMPKDSLFPPW